jgi:hypothetical protein
MPVTEVVVECRPTPFLLGVCGRNWLAQKCAVARGCEGAATHLYMVSFFVLVEKTVNVNSPLLM